MTCALSTRLLSAITLALLAGLVGCDSGQGGGGQTGTAQASAAQTNTTQTTQTGTTAATAAALTLAAAPTSVAADDSTNTTITITALSSTNAVVPGVIVALAADTGVMDAQTVTTGTNGKGTVTFHSGTTTLANRTATITATAGTVTAQIPIQISGSSVQVLSGSGLTVPDDGTAPVTITFVAKNGAGVAVAGTPISVSTTGPGRVTLGTTSGTTDSAGKFSTAVSGVTGGAGIATVTASAVGSTASATVTVSPTTAVFAISQTQLNAGTALANPTAVSMTTITDQLTVTVAAPVPTANVTFATTIGTWVGGTTSISVPVNAGTRTASAILTTANAGIANVQVLDPLDSTRSDTLVVSMTAAVPAKIILQASPSVVPKSVGTTTGTSTVVATVTDINDQPVGNAAVAFSIGNGSTGGGETVSPVVAYSAATAGGGLGLGQARTSFTSGSLTTGASGVTINAQVLGTAITTNTQIIIGGLAGSVAFGTATVLAENSNKTAYIQAMSVLVADANGSPAPKGTVINLSVWPIAWSTGAGCGFDLDTANTGTFWNEDTNEDLILGATEDGTRNYYATNPPLPTRTYCVPDPAPATTCTNNTFTTTPPGGSLDGRITPPNSASGTIASVNSSDAAGTVTTDENGVGMFNLTYGKNSAIWTVVRIRAKTLVAGSDATGEIQFRLPALRADTTPCTLPDSPYVF